METIDIKAERLSERTFMPFGRVLDSAQKKPDSEEADFKFYYNLVEADFSGPVAISIVESKVQEDLFGRSLESHSRTPEVLVPLDGTIYLVLTKSTAGDPLKPDPASARAFIVDRGQGVLLSPGIWHRAPLSKERPVKTCCLIRKGTPEDIVLHYMDQDYGLIYRVVL